MGRSAALEELGGEIWPQSYGLGQFQTSGAAADPPFYEIGGLQVSSMVWICSLGRGDPLGWPVSS